MGWRVGVREILVLGIWLGVGCTSSLHMNARSCADLGVCLNENEEFPVETISSAVIQAPQYPWFIFQDWSGHFDTVGYTPEEREKIAALGMGIWPIHRVLTERGREEIDSLRALNPDFVSTCIFSVMVVATQEPTTDRPLQHFLWDVFQGHEAKHVDGQIIRSWPSPESGPATAVWHTVFPASEGYTYNHDLLMLVLDGIEYWMRQYPGYCQGMWQDYYTTSGPYVWPTEEAAHGLADLDQDGIPFSEDVDEQAAWLDWENEFSRQLSLRFGDNFLQFPNGRAVYPAATGANPELAGRVHGAIFEGYPRLPWYSPVESTAQLHAMYTEHWSSPRRGHLWNLLHLRSNASVSDQEAARIASMVFLTPYFRASSPTEIFVEDVHDMDAGSPMGDLQVSVAGDATTYEREFERGWARLVANTGTDTLTPTWVPKP